MRKNGGTRTGSNSFFESEATYWLVVDQPGVYAKWVDFGEADDDDCQRIGLRR